MMANVETEDPAHGGSQSADTPPDLGPVLVTGGGGFLGRALIRQLQAWGVRCRSYARGAYPALSAAGVEVHRGEITDLDALLKAATGCTAIFHVAALPGDAGPWHRYDQVNRVGTERVIEVCRRAGISRLIYTSTPSVAHGGGDLEGVDESIPYPEKFHAPYPATKAAAERLVLAANGEGLSNGERLSTVALRPHLIWGPGDNHLIPRLIERGRKGRLRLLAPEKLVDSVWIEDAAWAHLCAWCALDPEAPCAGRPFFISQGEPWPMGALINGILAAVGEPPVEKQISPRLARWVGTLCELAWKLLPLSGEPPMTRFLAEQLSTAHWYNIRAARELLAYQPKETVQSALDRLKTEWKDDKR